LTATHTECIVVFPQQQWLGERATMLCYAYIVESWKFFRTSRRAPGPTSLLREGHHGCSRTSKRPEHEHKYSHLPSADIKDVWRNISTLPYNYMAWYITQPLNPLGYCTYHQFCH